MATSLKVELDPIEIPNRPSHVPPELVIDLRWAFGDIPVSYSDPYKETDALFASGVSPLLWMPNCVAGQPGVGAWVVTHYEDIARVYQDADLFSTKGAAAFQKMVGETWDCIPLGKDPPEHTKYRLLLNPHFSPKAIALLDDKIRAGVRSLIDGFADSGRVDAAYEFARIYPVRVFLDLMGFPASMLEQFLRWEKAILHNDGDIANAQKTLTELLAYLRDLIGQERQNPGPNLLGKIVTGEVDGRPMDDDEVIGTVFFLWLGGLDTVASTTSLILRRLAVNPQLQQTLRDNPDMLPEAIEEFLRVHPLVNSQRVIKKDFEWYGHTLKAGDWIMCMNTAGNFDPQEFESPREIKLDRQPNRHFSLAGGPHRCLGSHLARRELRVALEEWLSRIPQFRLAADEESLVWPGIKAARHVMLEW